MLHAAQDRRPPLHMPLYTRRKHDFHLYSTHRRSSRESWGAGEVFRGRQGWLLCYLCRPYTSVSPRCHVPPNHPIPFHFQRHRRQRGLLVSIFAIFFLLPPKPLLLLLLLFNKAHKFACNCVLRAGWVAWLTCSPPTATLPPTEPPPAAAADQSPAKCSFRLAALSHLPFACSEGPFFAFLFLFILFFWFYLRAGLFVCQRAGQNDFCLGSLALPTPSPTL